MDQINILKTIQLPESITGTIKDKFDAIDSNFNALGSSTYTAGKDGVTRVHTLKFNEGQVENRAEFEEWLTSQLGISNPKEVVDSIVNAFANYKKNDDWYANGSYEIYIGTDGNIKEALPILYVKDNTISYLSFKYIKDEKDATKDILILDNTQGAVLGIDNGYWIINGIKTNIKAEGIDGKDGENGTSIEFGFVTVEHAKQYVLDNKGKLTLDDEGNLASNDIDKSILVIRQYYDLTGNNNYVMDFAELSETKRKQWFDNNRDKVFLFTYKEDGKGSKTYIGYITKYDNTLKYEYYDEENKKQTINGYIYPYQVKDEDGNYSWVYNVDSSLYGFYYSDATIYSPGAGGSGVSGLITALDNMVYNQQVGDKPRGIWFKKTESETDKNAIFIYNDNNTLNICKIDDYTKAYNTGDIKGESTTVKVNGSFECDGAIISKNATINGDANIDNNLIASSATIYNSLSVDGEMDASTMECNSATITKNLKVNKIASISNDVVININDNLSVGKDSLSINKPTIIDSSCFTIRQTENNSNYVVVNTATPEFIKKFPYLGLSNGHKYIQVGGQNDSNEARVTTITPTKITSSDLKLIGDAVVNNNLNIGDSVYINNSLKVGDSIFNGTINDKSIYCDNGVYCDNIYSMSNNSGANLFNLGCDRNGGFLELKNNELPIKTTKISNNGSIINGNVEINGATTIKGVLIADNIITTNTDSPGSSGITLDNLKVNTESILKGTTTITDATINNLKVLCNNPLNPDSDSYMDENNYFIYPKLVYDVLKELGIIQNPSAQIPCYSLNISDKNIYKTNYCDLYIKKVINLSNYYNNNTIYSVGMNDANNCSGNLYRISGYIMINTEIELSNFSTTSITGEFEENLIKGATPQIIYIDDYFAFVYYYHTDENGTKQVHAIISPYGTKADMNYGVKFIPHYNQYSSNSNYEYDLNKLYSTIVPAIGGVGDTTMIHSRAKQSVIHTLGDNLRFKLIYDISKNP